MTQDGNLISLLGGDRVLIGRDQGVIVIKRIDWRES